MHAPRHSPRDARQAMIAVNSRGVPVNQIKTISPTRYANEELSVTASSIAAAAVAEEPGIGRGRVAELGACMADLIASDFEALEAAGLR